VYVDSNFWDSVDGYAASSGEQTLTIELAGEGSHLLEVRNSGEKNASSTAHKLRFKQVVVNRQYDLHTIQYAYDGISRLIDADYYPGVNVSGSPFRTYDYAYDPAGNRT
jgi:hypothetical protein